MFGRGRGMLADHARFHGCRGTLPALAAKGAAEALPAQTAPPESGML